MNRDVRKYLIFSVAINLLLMGFLLGTVSHTMVAPSHPQDIGQLTQKLPENERASFKAAIQPILKNMDDVHAQIEKDKQKLQELLKAEPYDDKAYIAEARHVMQWRDQQKEQMTQAVSTLAKSFSPEERAVLGDIVSRPPPGIFCPPGKK